MSGPRLRIGAVIILLLPMDLTLNGMRRDRVEPTVGEAVVFVACEICGSPVLLSDAVMTEDGLSCDLQPLRIPIAADEPAAGRSERHLRST